METKTKEHVPTFGRELGSIGLKVAGGVIQEEILPELSWPKNKKTYKEMAYDPTISSALNTIKSYVRRCRYEVVVDAEKPSKEQLDQIKFIEECMNDMDVPFNNVINEMLSMLIYGFSIHEKVFKYRDGKKSLYSDGKAGWAKLPIRSQDSIRAWDFDDKGRNLRAVIQDTNLITTNYSYNGLDRGFTNPEIRIPRSRFLHIRHDVQRNNPEGTSTLRSCFIPWRYKKKVEEFQSMGIARDLGGLPVISLPPEYMSDDAPEDKKAVYAYYKQIIENIAANEQAGLVLPKFVDPDTKQDMFTFDLISVTGGKMYDTSKIISDYENKILMTFLADVLKMGQESKGSFALSDNKTNLLAIGIEAFIDELLQEFNRDLIPQTMVMNGWNKNPDMPKIKLKELDDRDLDVLGQFLQRVVATGTIEVDQGLSDWVRKEMGAPTVDRTKAISPELIGGGVSKSGEGQKTGANNGTAKAVSATDNSVSNKA